MAWGNRGGPLRDWGQSGEEGRAWEQHNEDLKRREWRGAVSPGKAQPWERTQLSSSGEARVQGDWGSFCPLCWGIFIETDKLGPSPETVWIRSSASDTQIQCVWNCPQMTRVQPGLRTTEWRRWELTESGTTETYRSFFHQAWQVKKEVN